MVWSLSQTNFQRNIAVVIGINNYQNGIHSLKTAVNDASAIADLLQKEYKYQEVIRLFPHDDHGEATREKLKELLFDKLPNEIKPTESDRLLFYFAGHGIARNSEDGPAGALIPQDATLGKWETYLPMQDLNTALSKLNCHHLLVVLDCCFAGNFRWSSSRNVISALETIHREHYDRFIRYPAWQAITSAAHNQEALDYTDERGIDKDSLHSPFAKALINGLKDMKADLTGDKVITAPELYLHLRDNLMDKEGLSELQTPGIWPLKKHDRGEFIFTLPGFQPDQLKPAPPLNEDNNPYRGLQPYDEKHARFFFGRQQQVNQLSIQVSRPVSRPEQRLTVVLGISGSGKSSLVKAGLISHLRKVTNSFDLNVIYASIITLAILEVSPNIPLRFLPISYAHQWEILEPMRPGESPFDALAKAIFPLVETQDKLADNLKENPEYLSLILLSWSQTNPNCNLLLAIDQFEELITISPQVNPASNQVEQKDDIQKQFLALLVNAIKNCPQLHIVLTLRSDFEPRFIQSALKEYWTEARFPVRAMNLGELRQAIEQPAAEMALYFEPANLVNQLIDEVSQMPGALPLLSFTLSELYIKLHRAWVKDDKQERALTVDEEFYKQGGIAGSLSRRGNEIYDSLPDDAHRDTMRRVMLRMVALEGGEPVRRRVPESELKYANKQEPTQLNEEENQRVKVVLESLDKARLVVSGQETGEPYVEPAHDFLVKGWDKLQKWLEEKHQDLLLQRRLTQAAMEWDSIKNKDKDQPKGILDKAAPVLDWLDRRLLTVENLVNKIYDQFAQLLRPAQNQQGQSRENSVQFLWDANPYLDVLNKELKSNDNWFNQVEAKFVQKSVLQKRLNTSLRWRIGGAVTLTISAAAAIAFFQWINAQRQLASTITVLTNSSQELFESDKKFDALLASLNAGKNFNQLAFGANSDLQMQIKDALQNAIRSVKEQNRLEGHMDAVTSLSFSPDGKWLASASSDKTIRIWDAATGKTIYTLTGHTGAVTSLSFSSDGKWLASGSQDTSIILWDVATGQKIGAPLTGHKDGVNSVSFSPNGQLLASGSRDGNIMLWNVLKPTIFKTIEGHSGWVNSVKFSPDGQMLVYGSNSQIGILDVANGNLKSYSFPESESWGSIDSVSFSPDGSTLAFAGEDKNIKLLNLKTLKIENILKGYNARIKSVSFSPQGKILASAGWDNTIKLWDVATGQEIDSLAGHHQFINSISFGDEHLLASASEDRSIKIWNLSPEFNPIIVYKDEVWSLGFSPNGKLVASGSKSSDIKVSDVATGKTINSFSGDHFIRSITFHPKDENVLAFATFQKITLWNIATQEYIHADTHHQLTTSISFSPDGSLIAESNWDHKIYLWGVASGEGKITSLKDNKVLTGHKDQVFDVSFSPDGRLLASGSEDKSIILWDVAKGTRIKTLNAHTGGVRSVSFSPDGQLLVSGSTDGNIMVWDVVKGTRIKTLKGHSGNVSNVKFSPDGRLLASGSEDKSIILWDVAKGTRIKTLNAHTGGVGSVSFSPDGQLLVSGSSDKKVILWNLKNLLKFTLDDLLAQGCDHVGGYLQNNPNVSENDRKLCDGVPLDPNINR